MQSPRALTPAYSVPSLAKASGFRLAALRTLLSEHRFALIGGTPRPGPGRHPRGSYADALRLIVLHRLAAGGLSLPAAIDAIRTLDRAIVAATQHRTGLATTPAVLAAHLQDMALVVDADAELGGILASTQLIGAPLPSPHHGVLLVIDLGALADLAIRRLRDSPVRRQQMLRQPGAQTRTATNENAQSTGGGWVAADPQTIPTAGPTAQSKELT